jgi:predicted ATP-grasp superfamily ATP-dependent carboligase
VPPSPPMVTDAGPLMDLLIVGASVRAASQSARRAGLVPDAIDLFTDFDLIGLARRTCRLPRDRYPHGLPALAATFPPGPFLFTGGLENHPDILAAIARERPLWGVDPLTIAAVRNPFRVRDALRDAGLPTADIGDSVAGLPRDGSWLVKPRQSAGGLRLAILEAGTPVPGDGSVYFQKRLVGRSLGAVYLGKATDVELVGVTESRQGAPGAPFAYAGSVGPVPLSTRLQQRIRVLGQTLFDAFALRGLFGVDLIERDDVPIPIEVNPRYTASVEVLERATGRALLAEHGRVFEAPDPSGLPRLSDTTSASAFHPFAGKAIVYATAPLHLPEHDFEPPHFADLPAPGSRFARGEPILTVFARGRTLEGVQRRLDHLVLATQRRIHKLGEPFSPE